MRGFSFARWVKRWGAGSLAVPQQAVQLDADGMQLAVTDYMGGRSAPGKELPGEEWHRHSAGERHAGA
ncbi:Uncharacterised protein [Escherichia coli]|uniref:Uncharacterized protein n=1 Tax=Escherichia coli TaxID=562 RepID=A0A376KVN9_ECOLX|nr:Uncharacterised protein [Escherichia coli]